MVDVKEIQNLTYKNSIWTKWLKRKIDRKIKWAARHGRASISLTPPSIFGDLNVFLSATKEYADKGYEVVVCSTRWKLKTATEWGPKIVDHVEISWEKPIYG